MKHLHISILWLFISLVSPFMVFAQEDAASSGSSTLSLELDPAPFLLNGYSFSLRYSPASNGHLSIMGSVFAGDLPDNLLSTANREAGWQRLHFKASNALFVDYSLRPDGRGLFFGPSVFLYNNKVQHGPTNTSHTFRSIYPQVRVGYSWFPIRDFGLYVSPWLSIGKESKLGSTGNADGATYDTSGLKYIAAIHIGFRIGR